MKVMLVTRRGARTRLFDLNRPGGMFAFATAAMPLGLAVLALGVALGMLAQAWLGPATGPLRAALEAERAELARAEAAYASEREALAARLGELQARLLRLDALGSRLVSVAGLDPDEFNFGAPPSQGGPELDWLAAPGETGPLDSELETTLGIAQSRAVELDALGDLLLSRRTAEQSRPEGLPVTAGWISSYFGRRNDPFTGRLAHHKGIDFAGREGSPVVAVASGVVVYAGPRRGYGNLIEINHGGGLVTRYGHNKSHLVEVGATVERGDVIATMGSTGRSTGPHLHFEVHRNGRAVNPLAFIRGDAT